MLDRDTITTACARISGALCSIVVAASIVKFLDPGTQGYWYTFNSILGLASYAELGAGQIIMRFVAAERGAIEKPSLNRGRLSAILRFTVWYGALISTVAVA